MSKITVAFVGWRGMVGSVLNQRMHEENDFEIANVAYFSTSNAGGDGPDGKPLGDAFDIQVLSGFDVVLTCQGGDYTKQVHPELRTLGWQGYWIDAASALRMVDSSVLVLDPVNRQVIDAALNGGVKDLIGVNCTVSPLMMGLAGLFKQDLIEWISSMTYQAASGAGAKHMVELLNQMHQLGEYMSAIANDPARSILEIDAKASEYLRSNQMTANQFGYPLAANLLPWIDSEVEDGQSREEWKGHVETNKILGETDKVAVDGTCVRVGAMRSHSLALTIKLKEDLPLKDIESLIADAHEWVNLVPNNKEATLSQLTPVATNGTLNINVGRVRKLKIGPEYLNAFIIGDQLMWGAAEPLRRALRIVAER